MSELNNIIGGGANNLLLRRRMMLAKKQSRYSVNWNQLMENGDFTERTESKTTYKHWRWYGSVGTISETPSGELVINGGKFRTDAPIIPTIESHVYFVKFRAKKNVADINSTFYLPLDGGGLKRLQTDYVTYEYRRKPIQADVIIQFNADDGIISIDKNYGIRFIDLTQMFGEGNEPTSVSDFEAWLAENNLDGYQPYNEGEIRYTTKPSWIL